MTREQHSANSEVRRRGLEARRALSTDEKIMADRSIAERLLGCAEVVAAQTICIYLPLPEEVDTKPIIEQFFRLKKTVVVPKVSGDRLELHEISSFSDLAPGAFGVLEPNFHDTFVSASSVDVFIVPGVAFDKKGFRLGWGKGYYDKLLTGVTASRIGLAYNAQLIAQVPHTS